MSVKHIEIDTTYINQALNTSFDASSANPVENSHIGLSLCKQICKGLDGDIKVQSMPGKGTDFAFSMKVFDYSEHPALKSFTEDKQTSFEEEEGVNSDDDDNSVNEEVSA